ncbi:hypothetical protein PMZ80_000527 [Knufia obscura]|uniref:F-box domain-containing protein n=2 Tax=Knufia TaxID=430999 RepID=A0AAN8ELM1_9EURO|nr:hypothetical protein PMZ80_000527 [Knufia obscura]KAK5956545.1 hypothetical protein OHC33_002030 [Knufia fluminis]
MNVLSLPPEILSQILTRLTYPDLLAFSSTCREARSFTSPNNQLLWQATFLHKFDDPRDRWNSLNKTARAQHQQRELNWDWHRELRKRVVALKYATAGDLAIDEGDTETHDNVVEALLDIIDTAKACPTPEELQAGKKPEVDDRDISLNLGLLPINYHFTPEFDGLIRGLPASAVRRNLGYGYGIDSTLAPSMPGGWESTPGRPMTRSLAAREMDKVVRSEAACRLHVLCGLTEWEERDDKAIGRARRITYDWDGADESNEFGPFKRDGSGEVDWRRLEAVCTVVTRQFALAVRGRMTLPQGFCFSLPYRTLVDPTVPEDWAGVQGNWCGTYVFLHFEDLVEFNAFQNAANRPTLENGPEACGGLMKLELKLDMKLRDDSRLQTKMPICDDLPTLYFSGLSRSYDFQMATRVRGMACLTPRGEVRWRYIVQ